MLNRADPGLSSASGSSPYCPQCLLPKRYGTAYTTLVIGCSFEPWYVAVGGFMVKSFASLFLIGFYGLDPRRHQPFPIFCDQ